MKYRWLSLRRWRARRRVTHPGYLEFLRTPAPAGTTDFTRAELVCLDIETTGLDSATAAMLSVGWVQIREGFVDLSTAESIVVRSSKDVGHSASVHGLTDTVVGAGVDPRVALDRVINVLRGRVLVVHHAGLDKALLDRMCREFYGDKLLIPVIDTLALEYRRQARQHHIDDTQSLRLPDIRKRYGLPYYSGHNCLTDAISTAELLIAMVATHATEDRATLSELY